MAYLQMHYHEGAKGAKLREEKTRFDLASRNFAQLRVLRAFAVKLFWVRA
jgi:hypothetical protein